MQEIQVKIDEESHIPREMIRDHRRIAGYFEMYFRTRDPKYRRRAKELQRERRKKDYWIKDEAQES